jgi:hypothetical protein
LGFRVPHPLRHPELSDRGDDRRDIVVGGAEECLGFGSLTRRSGHRPAERIDALEQDWQQQPVLDTIQVKQWSPCLEAQ